MDLSHGVKPCDMGPGLYFLSEGSRAADFITLKNPPLWPCLNLGSRGKHDNHYTTENNHFLSNSDQVASNERMVSE
jgi:hypothetical protein